MMTDIFPSLAKHPLASASVPSLHHLPNSPSLTSLAHSEGDVPFYASTLVQEPSVLDLPNQSDIIIAYVDPTFNLKVCIQSLKYCSVMGPTGAGKSTVSFLSFNPS
jgi:ABC-type multidrug transport system fused ATPase/permease subunit